MKSSRNATTGRGSVASGKLTKNPRNTGKVGGMKKVANKIVPSNIGSGAAAPGKKLKAKKTYI